MIPPLKPSNIPRAGSQAPTPVFLVSELPTVRPRLASSSSLHPQFHLGQAPLPWLRPHCAQLPPLWTSVPLPPTHPAELQVRRNQPPGLLCSLLGSSEKNPATHTLGTHGLQPGPQWLPGTPSSVWAVLLPLSKETVWNPPRRPHLESLLSAGDIPQGKQEPSPGNSCDLALADAHVSSPHPCLCLPSIAHTGRTAASRLRLASPLVIQPFGFCHFSTSHLPCCPPS